MGHLSHPYRLRLPCLHLRRRHAYQLLDSCEIARLRLEPAPWSRRQTTPHHPSLLAIWLGRSPFLHGNPVLGRSATHRGPQSLIGTLQRLRPASQKSPYPARFPSRNAPVHQPQPGRLSGPHGFSSSQFSTRFPRPAPAPRQRSRWRQQLLCSHRALFHLADLQFLDSRRTQSCSRQYPRLGWLSPSRHASPPRFLLLPKNRLGVNIKIASILANRSAYEIAWAIAPVQSPQPLITPVPMSGAKSP